MRPTPASPKSFPKGSLPAARRPPQGRAVILQPQVVCGLPGQKGSWGWVGGNRFTGRGDGLKTLLAAGVGGGGGGG